MKQTLILALVSFLTAVAGGTVLTTKLMPPRPATPIDSVPIRADAARPAAPGASPKTLANPVAPKPTIPASTTDSARAVPSAPQRPAVVVDSTATARARGVAKILAQMKPKEAVAILAKLTDDEVERIIRQLNPKQLAALMAALPEERAAALSRRLLEPNMSHEGGS